MVGVAQLSNRRPAGHRHLPDLAGRKDQRGPPALLVAQPGTRPGRAAQRAALAGLELDVVDGETRRNVLQRHAVSRLGLRTGDRADDRRPVGEADRSKDVPLLAVNVLQEGDMRGPVGVVLDSENRRRHVVLGSPEVDEAIPPLVAAAPAVHRDLALVVPAAGLGQRPQEGFFRPLPGDLGVEVHGGIPPATGRGFVESNGHKSGVLSLGFWVLG